MIKPAALAAALLATTLALPALAAERASARLLDRQGAEVGTATLVEGPHGVLVHVVAKGLPPGPKAIHIHSVGTCEDGTQGFVASKGHLNPAARPHGLTEPGSAPTPATCPTSSCMPTAASRRSSSPPSPASRARADAPPSSTPTAPRW